MLIHHDSALILDWLNWFTIQWGSNASDQSRVMREAELICTSANHCLSDAGPASCSLWLPWREAPLQSLDGISLKQVEKSGKKAWLRDERECLLVSCISLALHNTVFADMARFFPGGTCWAQGWAEDFACLFVFLQNAGGLSLRVYRKCSYIKVSLF